MSRLALNDADWPHADRQLWRDLITLGGPLDDRGALGHLRETSKASMRRSYSYWLGWVAGMDPDAMLRSPIERATTARLTAWMEARRDLAPMSRFTMLEAVLRILSAAAPATDWCAQRRVLAHCRREAFNDFGARKFGRVVSSEVLVDAGLGIIASADGAATALQAWKRKRDGLLIVFLALAPMRLRALCALRINENLLISDGRYTVHLPRALCKAGGPWEATLPSVLGEPLRDYLSAVRPSFMSRGGATHDVLWVGDRGGPYHPIHLSARIARLTEKAVGVRIPPHFFRDCAATTLARLSPDAARLIRPILGHSGFQTAERHYNHAKALDTGRSYAALIDAMKEKPE